MPSALHSRMPIIPFGHSHATSVPGSQICSVVSEQLSGPNDVVRALNKKPNLLKFSNAASLSVFGPPGALRYKASATLSRKSSSVLPVTRLFRRSLATIRQPNLPAQQRGVRNVTPSRPRDAGWPLPFSAFARTGTLNTQRVDP